MRSSSMLFPDLLWKRRILTESDVVCWSYANVQKKRGLLMQRHIVNGYILLSIFNNS